MGEALLTTKDALAIQNIILLTIHVYAVDGTNAGYVDVDAADAQAYMEGEITDEQYAERVLAGLVVY